MQQDCNLDPNYSAIKPRTPSGSILNNPVSKLRTIFSPEDKKIHEVPSIACDKVIKDNSQREHHSGTDNQSSVETPTKRLSASVYPSSKGRVFARRVKTNCVNCTSDSETENFVTPPATPKLWKRNTNNNFTGPYCDENRSNEKQYPINPSASEMASNTDMPITEEVQQLMQKFSEEGKTTMDIALVHSMFKRLEENFNKKLESIESRLNPATDTDDDSQAGWEGADQDRMELDSDVEALSANMDKLRIKNKTLKSAAHKLFDNSLVNTDRIQKLELNSYKKMAILSGLYTTGTKLEVIEQIEQFIFTELNLQVPIDDTYEIGQQQPKAKVLIFQNLKDKMLVMRTKNKLKGLLNEDNRPFFISDFYPMQQNEQYKAERAVIQRNEAKGDMKSDLEHINGALCINGSPLEPKVFFCFWQKRSAFYSKSNTFKSSKMCFLR